MVDVYEPKVKDMVRFEEKKIIAAMDTILSKRELDINDIGY